MVETEPTGVEVKDIEDSDAFKDAYRATLDYDGGTEDVFIGDFIHNLKYMYDKKDERWSSTQGAGLVFNNIEGEDKIVVQTADGGFYLTYDEIDDLIDEYGEYTSS